MSEACRKGTKSEAVVGQADRFARLTEEDLDAEERFDVRTGVDRVDQSAGKATEDTNDKSGQASISWVERGVREED